jgi:hypothetical protein
MMGQEHRTSIPAHANIYDDSDRVMEISFTEPDGGITERTGLLLIIPGFGECGDLGTLHTMRNQLSNRYNMVVVQCLYFGSSFMGNISKPQFRVDMDILRTAFSDQEMNFVYDGTRLDVNKLIDVGSNYHIHLNGEELLNESLTEFNDMGIMQAIDNLSAVYAVQAILEDNEYHLDSNKMMVYGRGHGGYLAYLINALAPELFSHLFEQDAWIFPPYLDGVRELGGNKGKLTFTIRFDYYAKTVPFDRELLSLPILYTGFTNRATIHSYQNADIHPSALIPKKSFIQSTPRSTLHQKPTAGNAVSAELILPQIETWIAELMDREINEHLSRPISKLHLVGRNRTTRLSTKQYNYVIDYSSGMPVFQRVNKI